MTRTRREDVAVQDRDDVHPGYPDYPPRFGLKDTVRWASAHSYRTYQGDVLHILTKRHWYVYIVLLGVCPVPLDEAKLTLVKRAD